MNVAILGMGNMGSNYARLISQGTVSGMKLSAVTRIKESMLAKVQAFLSSDVKVYPSADELFAAFDSGVLALDAVLVVTPHYSHEELAVAAFSRGISVLCDKPAGVFSWQARHMLVSFHENRARWPGLQLGMIFQQRTNPAFIRMKQIVESGQYGRLKRVNWTVTDWFRPIAYYASGSWKAKWKTDGGGVILNQCPHNLDLLIWICGMPSAVQAFCHEGKYHPIEVEDEATVFLEWENGATGVFTTSTGEAAGCNRLELIFEDARLVAEDGCLRVYELAKPESELLQEKHDFFSRPEGSWKDVPVSETHPDQYASLLSAFQRGEPVADGEDGWRNLLLCNAIYASSWQQKKISIPEPGTDKELTFEQLFKTLFEHHITKKMGENYEKTVCNDLSVTGGNQSVCK